MMNGRNGQMPTMNMAPTKAAQVEIEATINTPKRIQKPTALETRLSSAARILSSKERPLTLIMRRHGANKVCASKRIEKVRSTPLVHSPMRCVACSHPVPYHQRSISKIICLLYPKVETNQKKYKGLYNPLYTRFVASVQTILLEQPDDDVDDVVVAINV